MPNQRRRKLTLRRQVNRQVNRYAPFSRLPDYNTPYSTANSGRRWESTRPSAASFAALGGRAQAPAQEVPAPPRAPEEEESAFTPTTQPIVPETDYSSASGEFSTSGSFQEAVVPDIVVSNRTAHPGISTIEESSVTLPEDIIVESAPTSVETPTAGEAISTLRGGHPGEQYYESEEEEDLTDCNCLYCQRKRRDSSSHPGIEHLNSETSNSVVPEEQERSEFTARIQGTLPGANRIRRIRFEDESGEVVHSVRVPAFDSDLPEAFQSGGPEPVGIFNYTWEI